MAVPAGPGIRFSWVTNDARRGQAQRGYELRVASNPWRARVRPAGVGHRDRGKRVAKRVVRRAGAERRDPLLVDGADP